MLPSTSNVATSPLLPPVKRSLYQKEAEKTGPNIVHTHPLPRRRGQLRIAKSQTQTRDIRCAAALNATCASGQTQTITRETRSHTITPGKAKTPRLDDSGPGLPPRNDDGNGGNGGGGGKFSGGMALLGILGILDVLKDIENDWQRKDDKDMMIDD